MGFEVGLGLTLRLGVGLGLGLGLGLGNLPLRRLALREQGETWAVSGHRLERRLER